MAIFIGFPDFGIFTPNTVHGFAKSIKPAMKSTVIVRNYGEKFFRQLVLDHYRRLTPDIMELERFGLSLGDVRFVTRDGLFAGVQVDLPKVGSDRPAVCGFAPVEQATLLLKIRLTQWLNIQAREHPEQDSYEVAKITWHAPSEGQSWFEPFACVRFGKS